MFLRATTRKKDGKVHRYWSIVENRRLPGGRVSQRHVLYLGEINSSQERAWRKSIEVLDERTEQSRLLSLFPEDRIDEALLDEWVVPLCLSQLRLCRPRMWARAGWRCNCGSSWNAMGSGPNACRKIARVHAGTRCCSYWWPIDSSRRAVNDGCIGTGSILVPWPICWAAMRTPVKSTSSIPVRPVARAQNGVVRSLVGRWRDLFNVEFDALRYDLTRT